MHRKRKRKEYDGSHLTRAEWEDLLRPLLMKNTCLLMDLVRIVMGYFISIRHCFDKNLCEGMILMNRDDDCRKMTTSLAYGEKAFSFGTNRGNRFGVGRYTFAESTNELAIDMIRHQWSSRHHIDIGIIFMFENHCSSKWELFEFSFDDIGNLSNSHMIGHRLSTQLGMCRKSKAVQIRSVGNAIKHLTFQIVDSKTLNVMINGHQLVNCLDGFNWPHPLQHCRPYVYTNSPGIEFIFSPTTLKKPRNGFSK